MKRRIKQTQPHGHMCGECSHGEPWTGPEGDPWNTRPDGQAITLHCNQDKDNPRRGIFREDPACKEFKNK